MAETSKPLIWRKHNWSKQELEDLYWGKRMSCRAIAVAYGLSNTGIRSAMTKLGIPKRGLADAIGRGKDNACWKGGKTYSGRGYIMAQKPTHSRANKGGYVMEHILIWEESHHQPLPQGWVVHHLNRIKTDNRPKNLLAMSKRGHSPALTMQEVQKRLREVEAELAQKGLWETN